MDPDATYRELCEALASGDIETARQRAADLKQWLRRGGFYPTGHNQQAVDARIALALALSSAAKFPLGQILITPAAADAIPANEVWQALARHASGDWGDVDDHDRQENEFSLAEGFRLLSAYHTSQRLKFWIITEADRSATTVLLPSDY